MFLFLGNVAVRLYFPSIDKALGSISRRERELFSIERALPSMSKALGFVPGKGEREGVEVFSIERSYKPTLLGTQRFKKGNAKTGSSVLSARLIWYFK